MDVFTERKVGKSELCVTPLGFGGGTIGSPQVTTADSFATVAAAWESGARFYDTAPLYGIGRSERRLGIALADIAPRDAYKLNTKIGKSLVPEPNRQESKKTFSPGGDVRTPRDGITGFRIDFEYTYERIMAQHHDSLQRLGISNVDSLTIHDIDYGYHSDEQIEVHLNEFSKDGGGGARALEELRANGSIKAIGCGCNLESRNAHSWPDGKHEDLCDRIVDLVDLDFFIVAGGYTLLETRALRRIMKLCEQRNIGVIIAAPYASGWLANPDESATYMYAEAPEEIVVKSRGMKAICDRHSVPVAAVAIQFPLAHPVVAAVIPGAKSPQEATQNRQLITTEVPPGVWDDMKSEGLLDENAPTPS